MHNHYQRLLNADGLSAARREREEALKAEELKATLGPDDMPYSLPEDGLKLGEDRSAAVKRMYGELDAR